MSAAMITRAVQFKWTPEKDALVADYLREGMTGQQIGVLLGVSRMSIIGRVNRNPMLKAIGFEHPAPTFRKVGSWQLPMEEPRHTSEPFEQSEPASRSAPIQESEPIPSREPFPPSEPNDPRVPEAPSEPNILTAPAAPSEPPTWREPTGISEPSTQREPVRASEPTLASVPEGLSEPRHRSEPVQESEPTEPREPFRRSEPRYIADAPPLDGYEGPGVPLLQIRDGLCRYPLWPNHEKGGPHFPMCGKQTGRQSRYCPAHTTTLVVRRAVLTLPAG